MLDTRGADEPAAMDIEVREAGTVAEVLAGVTGGAVAFRGSWARGGARSTRLLCATARR